MSIKHKIKQIETEISRKTGGTSLKDLLSSNYRYKGEPFNSIDEIIKALNVIDEPPYTDEQIIKLLQNKLLSYESPEMQIIHKKVVNEMNNNL